MPIGVIAYIVRDKIPRYLSNVPIPRSLKEFSNLSVSQWIRLLSFTAIFGSFVYLSGYPLYFFLYHKNNCDDKNKFFTSKEMHMKNHNHLTEFSSCWKSQSLPNCHIFHYINVDYKEGKFKPERSFNDRSINHYSSQSNNRRIGNLQQPYSWRMKELSCPSSKLEYSTSDASMVTLLLDTKSESSILSKSGSKSTSEVFNNIDISQESLIKNNEQTSYDLRLLESCKNNKANVNILRENFYSVSTITSSSNVTSHYEKHCSGGNTKLYFPVSSTTDASMLHFLPKYNNYKDEELCGVAILPEKKNVAKSLSSSIQDLSIESSHLFNQSFTESEVCRPIVEPVHESSLDIERNLEPESINFNIYNNSCEEISDHAQIEEKQDHHNKIDDIFSAMDSETSENSSFGKTNLTETQNFYTEKRNPSSLFSSISLKLGAKGSDTVSRKENSCTGSHSVITHYSVFSVSKTDEQILKSSHSSTSASKKSSITTDSSTEIESSDSKSSIFHHKSVKLFTQSSSFDKISSHYANEKLIRTKSFDKNIEDDVITERIRSLIADSRQNETQEYKHEILSTNSEDDLFIICSVETLSQCSFKLDDSSFTTFKSSQKLKNSSSIATNITLPISISPKRLISKNLNSVTVLSRARNDLSKHFDQSLSLFDVQASSLKPNCCILRVSNSLPEIWHTKKYAETHSKPRQFHTCEIEHHSISRAIPPKLFVSENNSFILTTTYLNSLRRIDHSSGECCPIIRTDVLSGKNVFEKKCCTESPLPSVRNYLFESKMNDSSTTVNTALDLDLSVEDRVKFYDSASFSS